jgi:hypothetical protein
MAALLAIVCDKAQQRDAKHAPPALTATMRRFTSLRSLRLARTSPRTYSDEYKQSLRTQYRVADRQAIHCQNASSRSFLLQREHTAAANASNELASNRNSGRQRNTVDSGLHG